MAVFAGLILATGWGAAAEPSPSGAALVQSLIDQHTRLEAFRKLYRRTEKPDRLASGADYFNPDLVVCPQPGGSPLYVILCDAAERMSESPDSFGAKNFDRLFPPPVLRGDPQGPNGRWNGKVVFAFTAEGNKAAPFGSDDLLTGYLADIDGDGLIERVGTTNYELDDNHRSGEVLEVKRVAGPHATAVLRVLINQDDDSTFGFALRPDEGKWVVQVGPTLELPGAARVGFLAEPPYVLTKVAAEFRWNDSTHQYEGPAGSIGEHFIMLNPAGNILALLREQDKHPHFAKTPVVPEPPYEEATPAPTPVIPLPTGKWVYHSLAGKSDAELLAVMIKGRSVSDVEFAEMYKFHFPDNFWDLAPKEAARALVEASRNRKTQENVLLAIDDLDGVKPPSQGEVGLDWETGGCGPWRWAGLTILKHRGDASELKFSNVQILGGHSESELKNKVRKTQAIPVPRALARQAFESIWWLGRIRTRAKDPQQPGDVGSAVISTSDGFGTFWFSGVQAARRVTLPDVVVGRWPSYDRDAFAGLAAVVLERLPGKLGIDPEKATVKVGQPPPLTALESFVYRVEPSVPDKSPKSEKWLEQMLTVVRDDSEHLRLPAIAQLVPMRDPGRYSDPRIDQVLSEVIEHDLAASGTGSDVRSCEIGTAACALAGRGQSAVYPKVMRLLTQSDPDGSSAGPLVEAAILCVKRQPENREALRAFLENQLNHLEKTRLTMSTLFGAVWACDFSELSPTLERLATASDDEIESERVAKVDAKGKTVAGRFHDARRILTVWKEEDPLTKFKLAACLESMSYRQVRVPGLLSQTYQAVPAEQRAAVSSFLEWLSKQKVPERTFDVTKLGGELGKNGR